jgi:hypothetical protein
MGTLPRRTQSCAAATAASAQSPALISSCGASTSSRWCATPCRCRTGSLALPTSSPRYTWFVWGRAGVEANLHQRRSSAAPALHFRVRACTESAEITSPLSACASASDSAVLPLAVGPARMSTLGRGGAAAGPGMAAAAAHGGACGAGEGAVSSAATGARKQGAGCAPAATAARRCWRSGCGAGGARPGGAAAVGGACSPAGGRGGGGGGGVALVPFPACHVTRAIWASQPPFGRLPNTVHVPPASRMQALQSTFSAGVKVQAKAPAARAAAAKAPVAVVASASEDARRAVRSARTRAPLTAAARRATCAARRGRVGRLEPGEGLCSPSLGS